MPEEVIHSHISPSYLKQIILCSRSLPKDAEALDLENEAASTGTIQHAYLNYLLSNQFNLKCDVPDIGSLAQDEIDEVKQVYDVVLQEYQNIKKKYARVEVLLEQKIILDSFLPSPSWGYVDIAFIGHKARPNKEGKFTDSIISVMDAKFGRIEVSVVEGDNHYNPQITAYWSGIYDAYKDKFEITKGKMCICQPKLNKYPSISVKAKNIIDYMVNVISPSAYLAIEETGKYNPSLSNCKYCKNASHCKFHHILAMSELMMLENPDMLSDEYIEEHILPNITNLKKYCDNIWDYCVKKAELFNKSWKGFKLGTARPSRVYIDDKKVKQIAIDKGYTNLIVESVLTPAQAEKVLGKDLFRELLGDEVTFKPGKTTLVVDATPRNQASIKDEFKGEK